MQRVRWYIYGKYIIRSDKKRNGTAKFALEKLRDRYITPQRRSNIGVEFLDIYAKSPDDNPDILPTCYKCGSTNPLIRASDAKLSADTAGMNDQCISCNHLFVRCFINFDVLPLIEFTPTKDIPHSKALELILKTQHDREFAFSLDTAANENDEDGLSTELFDACVLRSLNDKNLLDEDTNHKFITFIAEARHICNSSATPNVNERTSFSIRCFG